MNNSDRRMSLYFCQWTRSAAIHATSTYSEGFANRLIPIFNNINEEADKAAKAKWEESMLRPFNDDGFSDESMFAEDAEAAGIEVYENLHFVRQQLLGLAIAGLYHLWERTLKQFIAKEYKLYQVDEKCLTNLAKSNFRELCKILACFGYDIENTPHYKPLNELRLVTNTIKHGEGSSCEELFAAAPCLFQEPMFSFKDEPEFDDLKLSESDFGRYARAVEIFWQLLPERMILVQAPK